MKVPNFFREPKFDMKIRQNTLLTSYYIDNELDDVLCYSTLDIFEIVELKNSEKKWKKNTKERAHHIVALLAKWMILVTLERDRKKLVVRAQIISIWWMFSRFLSLLFFSFNNFVWIIVPI